MTYNELGNFAHVSRRPGKHAGLSESDQQHDFGGPLHLKGVSLRQAPISLPRVLDLHNARA